MRRNIAIFALISYIPFISVPVYAKKSDFSRTYPLPITEMQDVISKWFKDSDFKILRMDQELSRLRMSVEKREIVWEVCLSQQSPLATQVTICKDNKSRIDSKLENRLWEYISEYVNTPEIQVSNTQQKIPNMVMAQIASVVCIEATAKEKTYQASGFIINDNGHVRIISTAHDFRDLKKINVILYDGSEMAGKIFKIDFHRDISMIETDKKLEHFIPISVSINSLEKGEKLYAVSCPFNLKKAVFSGNFTAPKLVDDLILWQVQMDIYPGNSGSPVFDSQGNLAAIITGRYRGTVSVGFLIPFETLVEFLKS